ncbi:S-adenosyl-L-methionine-dependent methyltransferase [Blakeslea trispora]|nr:S-adenosyl-L-methionine-dependent methyltransferase [Blakeslea trispora]
MGNQPSKNDFIENLNEKRNRSTMHRMSMSFNEADGTRTNLARSKKRSTSFAGPVKHRLIVNDHTSLLTPLTSISNLAVRSKQHTKSMSSTCSTTSEEGEPKTPVFGDHYCWKHPSTEDSMATYPLHSKKKSSNSPSTQQYNETLVIEGTPQREHLITTNQSYQVAPLYEFGTEKERDRQTRQHYLLKQVLKGNMHVQLNEPTRILDSACGVGLWTLEIAHDYPKCQVVGIDVVPPSEKEGWSLSAKSKNEADNSNLTFQYVDILQPSLAFPDNHFDFVYQRDVATVLPFALWSNLIAEFFRTTKPGGQIQLVEYDMLFKHPGPVLTQMNEWYRLAASLLGVDPDYNSHLSRFLEDAGYVDVRVQVVKIAIGEWPDDEMDKQYGFLYKEQMKSLFKSMKRWWCVEVKLAEDKYDRICAEALEEFEQFKSTVEWKIFTARKP